MVWKTATGFPLSLSRTLWEGACRGGPFRSRHTETGVWQEVIRDNIPAIVLIPPVSLQLPEVSRLSQNSVPSRGKNMSLCGAFHFETVCISLVEFSVSTFILSFMFSASFQLFILCCMSGLKHFFKLIIINCELQSYLRNLYMNVFIFICTLSFLIFKNIFSTISLFKNTSFNFVEIYFIFQCRSLCGYMYRYLKKPEETIRSSGAGVRAIVSHPSWVLGI